jgi:hypothetical protein
VLCSILKSAHMIKTPLGALVCPCCHPRALTMSRLCPAQPSMTLLHGAFWLSHPRFPKTAMPLMVCLSWCRVPLVFERLVGAYTVALAVAFVIAVFLIVQPLVNLTYRRFRTKGDVADSGLFSSIMILMLLVVSFTSEVIGLCGCVRCGLL